MRLIPKEISIESEFKTFSLQAGASQGGKLAVTFVVIDFDPDDKDNANKLSRMLIMEKEKLDVLCLVSELSRGSISQQDYEARMADLRRGYAAVLRSRDGQAS